MPAIGIYGSSDDAVTIEVDGTAFEEVEAPKKGAAFALMAQDKGLDVHVVFDGTRGWLVTTGLTDERESGPLPFIVELKQRGRSPMLLVTSDRPITLSWWDEKRPRTKTFTDAPVIAASHEHQSLNAS